MAENNTDGERFQEFVRLISSTEKEIRRIRAVECERLGLRGADLMCLYYLGRSSTGMTAAELARTAGVTRAAVCRTIASLGEAKLVEVKDDPESTTRRYRAEVCLTQAGREVMGRVDQAISRVMSRVDSALDGRSRVRLYDSLESVLECLRGIGR